MDTTKPAHGNGADFQFLRHPLSSVRFTSFSEKRPHGCRAIARMQRLRGDTSRAPQVRQWKVAGKTSEVSENFGNLESRVRSPTVFGSPSSMSGWGTSTNSRVSGASSTKPRDGLFRNDATRQSCLPSRESAAIRVIGSKIVHSGSCGAPIGLFVFVVVHLGWRVVTVAITVPVAITVVRVG